MAAVKRISIVIPCYNEAEAFPHLRAAVTHLVDNVRQKYDVEVVLVNDGSRDGTWEQIRSFSQDKPWVRGIDLSRNFGHQAALTCGYQHAMGDAIVCLDADLQDPPSVIDEMITEWENGADVVYAVRKKRAGESAFKLITAAMFYRGLRMFGASYLRADCGDFRLMSRASLNAFLSMPEKHRFIRGMVGWVGFRTKDVFYDRAARVAGETKYPFKKMLKLATDAVISSSTLPLRFPYYFALTLTAFSALYLGYLGVSHWWSGQEFVRGWMSLVVLIVMFGCLNMISLGILGEYVGRIYEQAKDRPIFIVREQVGEPISTSMNSTVPLRKAA